MPLSIAAALASSVRAFTFTLLSCLLACVPVHLQLYNGAQNPYFLASKRIYDMFWAVMRSSILPNLEAAGIVEPKL
jgi:hypothetical protein